MKNNFIYKLLKKAHWKWVYLTSTVAIKITEPFYDWKFKIKTYKTYHLENDNSLHKDATFYMGFAYIRILKVFRIIKPGNQDILVDIGSGMGRVIFLAKLYNIKKAIGIELDESLHNNALKNSDTCNIKADTEVKFLNMDAIKFNDVTPTIYVLFNPFGLQTLEVVMDNIKETLMKNPRKITIVYLPGWQKDCHEYMNNLKWLQVMDIKEKHVPSIYTTTT